MPTKNNIAAIIDIGSAETKVILADPIAGTIFGVAVGKTSGMQKGEIGNLKDLNSSVHDVIRAAEESTEGLEIRGNYACLTISSVDVAGTQIRGYTSVKDDRGKVSKGDMEAAREDAYSNSLPPETALVHCVKQDYVIDGKDSCENPEGKVGRRISYGMWRVCAGTKYLTELVQIPNAFSLKVERIFLAALAADKALSDSVFADKNRLVIDIGAGTTDYALFQENILTKTGVVPVGGEHITNDIAQAIRAGNRVAERLKISHASALVRENDASETIMMVEETQKNSFGGDKSYSKFVINFVVNLRVEELFELIKKELPAGTTIDVVKLVGGSSRLKEIDVVSEKIFSAQSSVELPNFSFVSVPEKFTEMLSDPKFSAAVGALALLVKGASTKGSGTTTSRERPFFGAFKKLFFSK